MTHATRRNRTPRMGTGWVERDSTPQNRRRPRRRPAEAIIAGCSPPPIVRSTSSNNDSYSRTFSAGSEPPNHRASHTRRQRRIAEIGIKESTRASHSMNTLQTVHPTAAALPYRTRSVDYETNLSCHHQSNWYKNVGKGRFAATSRRESQRAIRLQATSPSSDNPGRRTSRTAPGRPDGQFRHGLPKNRHGRHLSSGPHAYVTRHTANCNADLAHRLHAATDPRSRSSASSGNSFHGGLRGAVHHPLERRALANHAIADRLLGR